MATIRVWDPLTRIVHWSVACLVIVDLLNEAGANPWHRYLGYAAGALVLLRLGWGIVGPSYARVLSIFCIIRRLVPYLAALRSGSQRIFAGHNPLGGIMTLILWTMILFVIVTGWMLQLDAFWGDDTVQKIHATAAYVLAGCTIVHVLGVAAMSIIHRVNLVTAMITGRKRLPESAVLD